MRAPALLLAITAAGTALTGCYYYGPAPGYYAYNYPATYERAWGAALGALQDAGVQTTSVDQGAGVARGTVNGVDVTVSVNRQADGTTRVQFDARPSDRDPTLAQRFSQAYERRMGR
jgi:hypothetical protein